MVWMVKNLPAMRDSQVQSLGQEDPLEKGMTTHSSILTWRIPWTEELGWLQSKGSQRAGQTEQLTLSLNICKHLFFDSKTIKYLSHKILLENFIKIIFGCWIYFLLKCFSSWKYIILMNIYILCLWVMRTLWHFMGTCYCEYKTYYQFW